MKQPVLPNLHSIEQCWNPWYHSDYKPVSALVLENWYRKQSYGKSVDHTSPLCVFGGVMWHRYADQVSANGTYAVCPQCQCVMHAGFGTEGVGPKNCRDCQANLELGDYFQPVFNTGKPRRADPNADPALVITQVIGLTDEALKLDQISQLAFLLKSEGLLESAVGVTIDPTSDRRHDEMRTGWWAAWEDWLIIGTIECTLGQRGRTFLEAKGWLTEAGRQRVAELLSLDPKELYRQMMVEYHKQALAVLEGAAND